MPTLERMYGNEKNPTPIIVPERVEIARRILLFLSSIVPPMGFEPMISRLRTWRPWPLDEGGLQKILPNFSNSINYL